MRRPRRIFRQSSFVASAPRLRWFNARLVGPVLVVVAIGVGGPLLLTSLPTDLFGRVPTPSGTISAEPRAVAVVDGDTLRLAETVIRLQGVEAPHRGTTCHAADGSRYDCGTAAAAALGRLVRGQRVACQLAGRDRHGMPQGRCDAGGTAVNRAIVAAGWARAEGDIPDGALDAAERDARAAMRGVWRGSDPSF